MPWFASISDVFGLLTFLIMYVMYRIDPLVESVQVLACKHDSTVMLRGCSSINAPRWRAKPTCCTSVGCMSCTVS